MGKLTIIHLADFSQCVRDHVNALNPEVVSDRLERYNELYYTRPFLLISTTSSAMSSKYGSASAGRPGTPFHLK